uniref:Uncharacterized protein n=1 Tax=Escherichia phage vB_EcoS_P1338 TaxID=3161150 RepID=A0AAU7VH07_9CAUD
MSLIKIIREAIVNNALRTRQFDEIAKNANCSRAAAKRLHFSFLYYATEDYLQDLLKNS